MIFKERRYECDGCGTAIKALAWDTHTPVPCSCGGKFHETALVLSYQRNRGVIDDQIEGGPRFFDTLGHEPVYIESKSQWRREVERHNVQHVVRHDNDYYVRQRRQHDEMLRDTGQK